MADALCGPSNPLQNLQKHTQVDRTLQQDRLVSARQSPGQGFRTADHRAGALDADFYAFENAAPNPFQFHQPEFANTRPAAFSPQPTVVPGGWAADFQRLNLHDHPVPAGQFRTEAPLIKSTVGGWQNDFMRQRSSVSSPVAQGKQVVQDQPQFNMNMNTGMPYQNYSSSSPYQTYGGGMYQDGGYQQQQPQMSMEQQVQMSDVDFDAAFQEAIAHAQEMDHQLGQMTDVSEETMDTSTTFEQQTATTATMKIGSDAIEYREQSERTADQDSRDADELARTAGQLLRSVNSETSTKFQNSQFLDLMRRIRDREVEVQNNELQDVSTGASATATQPERQDEIHQQQDQSSHFEFPNMDAVYAPATNVGRNSPYTNYGFDDDEYAPAPVAMQPQRQVDDVHPGGRWYPDQSPQMRSSELTMGGGGDGTSNSIENIISTSDFEHVDENPGLARRYT
ncbi:hypothetical protein LTR47_002868 [Exophiala xenobiotica]|nr:hypothetical protein LTR72_003756 [Exophiala xenobiotica]KAK5236142.1 hypothetical protein LTR47_002868 [Exophiala xenobiotica]KAK5255136.1 hypothetical protein LTS06_000549 [Exophiala xenobiotica]KAK5298673.1 hypothetical protein LTR14_002524 [Exophiala xenobiotica]KAK5330118.1 hypothetical protein LTR93_001707 [Exophiala xenobiotica]